MSDGFELDFGHVFQGISFMSGRIQKAAERGMERAMNDLLQQSESKAPKLSGRLRQGGRVVVTTTKNVVKGEVTYSAISVTKKGWAYDYALQLHEYPEKFKNPTTPGTGPKFLSSPLKARRKIYQEWIAEEIRKELSR